MITMNRYSAQARGKSAHINKIFKISTEIYYRKIIKRLESLRGEFVSHSLRSNQIESYLLNNLVAACLTIPTFLFNDSRTSHSTGRQLPRQFIGGCQVTESGNDFI